MAELYQKKTCFVIGPIGEEKSQTRSNADWFLKFIVGRVLKDFPEFRAIRADKITKPGMIDSQIINLLHTAELVIADMTERNANVFYELGIRHQVRKPAIHMRSEGDGIPFDVVQCRAIPYSRRRGSVRKAREGLRSAINEVLADGFEVDNPVARAERNRATQHQELVGTQTNMPAAPAQEKSLDAPIAVQPTKIVVKYIAESDPEMDTLQDQVVRMVHKRIAVGGGGAYPGRALFEFDVNKPTPTDKALQLVRSELLNTPGVTSVHFE